VKLKLPLPDGALHEYRLRGSEPLPPPAGPFRTRVAFAAAHVVADPLADNTPGARAAVDWDATLRYRHHLWNYGFGVAEAMDTAQRGMGLDWAGAQELIRRSAAEAKAVDGLIACGAGTDQLAPAAGLTLDQVIAAYEEQCAFVEAQDSPIILMASRALAATARGSDDYFAVYGRILEQVKQPVIIHWLGDMFDPALAGYWGSHDLDQATVNCLALIDIHAPKIDGIKVSLLDEQREIDLRRRLPAGVRMYTGDDFNYPRLILGDEQGYSDALLGIFDAIAPAAANALAALDAGDIARYNELLEPTLPLSRHIFEKPTYFYKTGIVFLAWLNGYQDHFRMVAGQESGRSLPHLSELLILADRAGLLRDPEMAARRMKNLLAVAGVGQ
jgi:hypothetical protein